MSAEEEQFEEGATGGAPGAPTPVSALEVCIRPASFQSIANIL